MSAALWGSGGSRASVQLEGGGAQNSLYASVLGVVPCCSAGSHALEWTSFDLQNAGLIGDLCDRLRLILEPSTAKKLKGDFRSGKRINMKRVRLAFGRLSLRTLKTLGGCSSGVCPTLLSQALACR